MKKATVILIALFISYFDLDAQINLEHTFNQKGISWSNSIQMYYYVDNNNIYFYNDNYSFYKSVNIPVPSGYSLGTTFYHSTTLFNNDSFIEFCCFYSTDDYSDIKSEIINENGSIVKTFGTSNIGQIYSVINNGYRMNVARYTNYPTDYVNDIYSLPGSLSSINGKEVNNLSGNPYPNPSEYEIYLPYKLNKNEISDMIIFDINGKTIDRIKIGGHLDKIRLNTSDYVPGVYIYKYNNTSNNFIVK